AHLERGCFDLDRLIAILRKPLHCIGHARHRALCACVSGDNHRQNECGRARAHDAPDCQSVSKNSHLRDHFGSPFLADEGRALGEGAATASSVSGALADWSDAPRLSKSITTLPSNLTTSPPPVILSLSALSVPCSNLTSTCSSEIMVPLPMSTNACDSRASYPLEDCKELSLCNSSRGRLVSMLPLPASRLTMV